MRSKPRQFRLPAGKRGTFVYPKPEPAIYERLRRLLATVCLPTILIGGIGLLVIASPNYGGSIAIMGAMTFATTATVIAIAFCQA